MSTLSDLGKNVLNKVVSGPVSAFSSNNIREQIRGVPASISNTVLGSVDRAVNDFFSAPQLRDWQHASTIFRSNSYANAPKTKHIFYVYFGLNRNRLENLSNFAQQTANNPNYGVLVKTCELPKFQIQTTEMNQYNRKRHVQTRVNYDPVKLTFHDDGGNTVNRLWYAYFTYHYRDSANLDSQANTDNTVNRRNIYDPSIEGSKMDWGFFGEPEQSMGVMKQTGYGNPSKVPFFKYISLFSLNQKTFTEYRLMNPIIESFGHDGHDVSSANGTLENSMSIKYEYVVYNSGAVGDSSNLIPMFARDGEMDKATSPIKTPGSSASILGDGGLIDSIPSVDQFLADPIGSVRGVARSAAQFSNPQKAAGAISELISDSTGGITRNLPFNIPFL